MEDIFFVLFLVFASYSRKWHTYYIHQIIHLKKVVCSVDKRRNKTKQKENTTTCDFNKDVKTKQNSQNAVRKRGRVGA